jgi:hypothetical protein
MTPRFVEGRAIIIVAVSHHGIFYGTILFKGFDGCHSDEPFSADCEPPVFSADVLQRIVFQLKRGEVEGEVGGYEWNVQDIESTIWRPN